VPCNNPARARVRPVTSCRPARANSFRLPLLYSFGGFLRAISASSAPIRPATRSNSPIAALSLARNASGKRACACCCTSASAISRICLRLLGFNCSHSLRFALRLRPSHCSPVPAGRPASGSATGISFCVFARITPQPVSCAFLALCVDSFYFLSAANPSQFTCPSCSTLPVTRSARVSNTSPPYFS